jgi:hypothetical protein
MLFIYSGLCKRVGVYGILFFFKLFDRQMIFKSLPR